MRALTRYPAIPAAFGAVLFFALGGLLLGDLDGSYVLPTEHNAIRYTQAPHGDPVSRLGERLRAGEEELAFDPQFGYLPAFLKALNVPVSSQVLVFSKTSFQAPRIAPRIPRAIYFNDEVTVGWVRGGDVVEITAVDPKQGVYFYTLDQIQSPRPRVIRRGECLQCHASGGTLGVPGLVVRSVYPDRSGMPLFHAGTFVTDHRSPLSERWGGWYVTGKHGAERHMGNVTVQDVDKPDRLDREEGANLTSLQYRFDTGAYLSPHSDIVALMVLEHQTRMTNMITRVGWETRMALHDQKVMNEALGRPAGEITESTDRRVNNAVESLLRYLLFTDEAPLKDSVSGTSGFAGEFVKQGPRDSKGRSLRDLDLNTRLQRYPCSFLIHSEAFDGLPELAKDRIYRRLGEILSGRDSSEPYRKLEATDRKAVLEILRETKPEFAAALR